jgi:hypothetical protein
MLPLQTRKELEQRIRRQLATTPEVLAGVESIGLTGSTTRKWNVFVTGSGPGVNGEALRRAETVSQLLESEFDLAEEAVLPRRLPRPHPGYRTAELLSVADIDEYDQWINQDRPRSHRWEETRKAIEAAKAQPTSDALHIVWLCARAALMEDETNSGASK